MTVDEVAASPIKAAAEATRAPVRPELRLALGMRGGVSLAVWIGGACREVDDLRRAGPASGADDFWWSVLSHSRYRRVVVDVLAGASAGGLNGVILAASIRYGFPLAPLRQTWLDVADLRPLIRRAEAGAPSLLRGDEFFLTQFHEKLRQMIGSGGADGPPAADAPGVDLQLSATLVEPIEDIPGARAEESRLRYSARFHFQHQPQAPWIRDDLPAPAPATPDRATAPSDATVWRLATAARATSSFPGAFEAAVVRSSRPLDAAEATGETGPGPAVLSSDAAVPLVDMRGVFSESRGAARDGTLVDDDFVVSDGGILDNIPLAKAIDAIVAAPSSGITDRVLVYVQPGGSAAGVPGRVPTAEDPPTHEARQAARRSTRSVVAGMVHTRVFEETITEDLHRIRDHNAAIDRAHALRRAVFAGPLPSLPGPVGDGSGWLANEARRGWSSYRRQRSVVDAGYVASLLGDPVLRMGEDPFPCHGPLGQDEGWHRVPLGAWDEQERDRLAGTLIRVFDDRLAPLPVAGADDRSRWDPDIQYGAGLGTYRRVVGLLIEAAVQAERLLADSDDPTAGTRSQAVGEKKQWLYLLQLFMTRVLDRDRRTRWVVEAAARSASVPRQVTGPYDPLRRWCDEAAARVDSPMWARAGHAPPVWVEPDPGSLAAGTTHLNQQLAAWADAIRDPGPFAWDGAPFQPSPDLADLRVAFLLPVIESAAATLAAEADLLQVLPATSDDASPASTLLWCLRGSLPPDGSAPSAGELRARLAAMEVLCFAEYVSGAQGQHPIRYVRMSSENRTPVAGSFAALTKAADGSIPPDAKLAGNELMNFAAFLKAEWRANDWMWGRLDAVPTLVDLLVDEEWVEPFRTEPPTVGIGRLEALLTGHRLPSWSEHLKEMVWDPDLDDGHKPVELAWIRDALIARRQWEILGEEMVAMGRAASLEPAEVRAATAAYEVGEESIRRDRHMDHVDTFKGLAEVASHVAVASLPAEQRTSKAVERTRRILVVISRVVTEILLSPETDRGGRAPAWLRLARTRLGAGLAFVLLSAGVGWWAWSIDHRAAIGAGAAAAVATAAAILSLVWFLTGSEPPKPPPEPPPDSSARRS